MFGGCAAAAVTVLTLFMSRSWPVADTRQSRLPSGLHCAPASPPDKAPTYTRVSEVSEADSRSTQGLHCIDPGNWHGDHGYEKLHTGAMQLSQLKPGGCRQTTSRA